MITKEQLDELSAATRTLAAAKERCKLAWDELNDARREEGEAKHRHEKALNAVADAA